MTVKPHDKMLDGPYKKTVLKVEGDLPESVNWVDEGKVSPVKD